MIYIFGDSFSVSKNPDSWTNLLGGDVTQCSSNGSSEYRIWKTYNEHKNKITDNDSCIFVHTSPYRIFLKDDVPLSSRAISTHTHCDILFNDVYSKKEKDFINILTTIWDDDFFEDTYRLYIDDLLTVPNSIHITFFPIDLVESLHTIWQTNKGTTNHMSAEGNRQTSKRILQLLAKSR